MMFENNSIFIVVSASIFIFGSPILDKLPKTFKENVTIQLITKKKLTMVESNFTDFKHITNTKVLFVTDAKHKEVKAQIIEMIDQGIVQPSMLVDT